MLQGYATSLRGVGWERVLEWYERRFRIECVFRESRGMMPRISARRAAWRFWWLCMAFVLYSWVNAYILLRHKSAFYRGWFVFVVGLRLGDMPCVEVRELLQPVQEKLYTNKPLQKIV